MRKAQVEVITSVQRRRRWSRAEKERIVAASMEPGAVASEVARAAGIHSSQLFRWRQQLCDRPAPGPGFAAVTIATEPSPVGSPAVPIGAGFIEIEFAGGARLRLSGAVDARVVSAVVRSLTKRAPRR
jgi:transposase